MKQNPIIYIRVLMRSFRKLSNKPENVKFRGLGSCGTFVFFIVVINQSQVCSGRLMVATDLKTKTG